MKTPTTKPPEKKVYKTIDLTPHELHKRLRENGYSPTVSEAWIERQVKPFKETLTKASNIALGEGDDRFVVIRIDGILGDITAAIATSDHIDDPDLIDSLKVRNIQ
jgi:hypothetical protein